MNGLLPSPFLRSADVAETLPSEFSGKSHCSAGSHKTSINYDALFDAGLPEEAPVFLRQPSQAFIRALLELSK